MKLFLLALAFYPAVLAAPILSTSDASPTNDVISSDTMSPSSASDSSGEVRGDASFPSDNDISDKYPAISSSNDNLSPEVKKAQAEASLSILANFAKVILLHTSQVAQLNGVTLDSVVNVPEFYTAEEQKGEEQVLRDILMSILEYTDTTMNGLEAIMRATEAEKVKEVAERLQYAFE